MSKKEGLATSYCLQATLLMILKASELENLIVKLVTRLKSDSALESYQQCPTLEQQVQSLAITSDIVAGSTQYQVSKERVLMETQQNQLVKEASLMSSAGCFHFFTGREHITLSHVEYYVIPSRQTLLTGKFHNHCIFNIKNFLN